ncbi:MAG: hypothetical protein GY854_04620 [Deltaproteobacteria bacterium]|nr:hypothetical protein [Deltaproteobacteria bacterium]
MRECEKRFNLSELQSEVPSDRGELFLSYWPTERVVGDWKQTWFQRLQTRGDRPATRGVYCDPENIRRRLLVEITECASAWDAIDELAVQLTGNNAPSFESGPKTLGKTCLVQPAENPTAIYFTRGNLSIRVSNFGPVRADPQEFAKRIADELDATSEQVSEGLRLNRVRTENSDPDTPFAVEYKSRWKPGKESYMRCRVKGGTVERGEDGRVLVKRATKAGVKVKGFIVEEGRETICGRIEVRGRRGGRGTKRRDGRR